MGVEPQVRKAFAYVTRCAPDGHELVVFRSLDEPEGFEVPKGAVNPGETFHEGARRYPASRSNNSSRRSGGQRVESHGRSAVPVAAKGRTSGEQGSREIESSMCPSSASAPGRFDGTGREVARVTNVPR